MRLLPKHSTPLLLAVAAVVAVPTLASLCDTCFCSPDTKEPVHINCTCSGDDKKLVVGPSRAKELKSVRKFTVTSSCQSVSLQKNAFAQALNLSTVNIQGVRNVSVAMGVFSVLEALVVEGVARLQLDKKAFMGVDTMKNVVIRRSALPEIPEYAFYNMTGLSSIELENVTVGVVRANGVLLSMGHGASVKIDDCKIENIEENGLVMLAVNEFNLMSSQLDTVDMNGINITSNGSVELIGNDLGPNVTSESILIQAQSINVGTNKLHHFLSRLSIKPGGHFSFSNNTLMESNWKLDDLKSVFDSTSNGNRLRCMCSQQTKDILPGNSEVAKSWLERNYCDVPCKLSLLNFPQRCNASSDTDDVNSLCEGVQMETSTTMSTNSTTTTRKPNRPEVIVPNPEPRSGSESVKQRDLAPTSSPASAATQTVTSAVIALSAAVVFTSLLL